MPVARKVGDGGLDQVTGAVELMGAGQLGPALGELLGAAQRVEGVEVAVRELGGGDGGDHVVDRGIEGGIGIGGQRPGCGLQPLVDIGVVEVHADRGSGIPGGRATEVVEPVRRLEELVLGGDGHRGVATAARLPDGIREADGIDRKGMQQGTGAGCRVDDNGQGFDLGGHGSSKLQGARGEFQVPRFKFQVGKRT